MRLFSSVAVAVCAVVPLFSYAAGYREKVRVMPPALKSPSSSLGGVTMTFDFMDTRGDGAVGQSGSRIWVVDNLEPSWGPAVRRAMQDSGAVVVNGKEAPWALTVELGKIEMQVDMLGGFVDVGAVATLMRGGEQVWRKNVGEKKKISGLSDLGQSISKVLAGVMEDALERAGNQLLKAQASGGGDTKAAAAAPAAAAGTQPRLAVLEFRGELPFATLKLLGDEARAGVLEGTGQKYLVMTREALAPLAKEKCPTPDGCDVDMGKKVGADVVVTGDVVKLGRKLRTSIKVLDVHNGALLASKSFSAEGEDALLDQVKTTVAGAIKEVR